MTDAASKALSHSQPVDAPLSDVALAPDLRELSGPGGKASVKVAALVLNSVSHDARVIKEAESLASDGFRVTIVGIQDNRQSKPDEVLPSGVRIRRVDWKGLRSRRTARLASWAIAGCFLGLLLLLPLYLLAREELIGLVAPLVATTGSVLRELLVLDREWHVIVANAIILCGFAGLLLLILKLLRYRSKHVVSRDGSGSSAPRRRSWRRWVELFRELARQYAHFGAIDEAMLAELEKLAPDIVHCHDLTSLPTGVRYKRRHRALVVYDSHEIFEEAAALTGVQRRFYRVQQHRFSPGVDRFITINESIGEFLTHRYPRLPKATIVMNATLSLSELPAYDGRLHAAAGLDRSVRIVLYQGGYSPHRGLPQLVQSAAFLPEGWVLVLMGWGRLEPNLRTIAQSVDPEARRIRFVPGAPHAELVRWTQGAEIGVIPYENVCLNHWFCTPNKLWEYPNAGVPILASPFPELERIVRGEGIGWLLPEPISPQSLAASVARITPQDLADKRAACRRFIARDNWSVYEERLVELYREAAVEASAIRAGA